MKNISSIKNTDYQYEENPIPIINTTTINIFLEIFTKIIRKEEQDKCICHPVFNYIDNISTFNESEVISGLQIIQNEDNQIKFIDITAKLKLLGYPVTSSLISIYNMKIDDYIYLGADPIDSNLFLDIKEFENINLLKIKIVSFFDEKQIINPKNSAIQLEVNQINSKNSKNPGNNTKNPDKKANKRTKERKIGYIIEKVNAWRKYYNGYYDENGNFTKFSLDDAATKIDISKKSLDDYLLQLRLGRKYGFDFNLHRNDKVGILRAFVKENRKRIINNEEIKN